MARYSLAILKGKLPKKTDDGWLVSQVASEYFVFMVPLAIVFALIPWILLVMFSASFGVVMVGVVPAGMISYAYVKIAINFSRLRRVTVNRSHLKSSRFGNEIQYLVADIEKVEIW